MMSQLNVDKVTVLGAGKMGNTLIHAMRQGGLAADKIVATGRREEPLGRLAEREGVTISRDNRAAVAGADLVLLCVKPQVVAEVLDEIGGALTIFGNTELDDLGGLGKLELVGGLIISENHALTEIAEIDALRATVNEWRSTVADRQSAHNQLHQQAAERDRRLAAIDQESGSWQDRASGAEARIANLSERRTAAAERQTHLTERPEQIEEQRKRLFDAIATAEAGRQSAADALAAGWGFTRPAP